MRISLLVLVLIGAAVALEFPALQPAELAARLAKPGEKPVLFHVGFGVLYRSKHIPGSTYVGPGAQPSGIEALKAAAGKLPRDLEIVVYCGCCPWDKCPNIKPSMEALREMGFTRVKALYVPTNLAKDWYDHGYPAEAGSAAAH